MAINLATVMDQIGVRLATITGLNVFDYAPKSAQVPFAFVDMPESIEYDLTAGRGSDRMTLRVFVAVADVLAESARDAVAEYAAGAGARSIKAAIEGGVVGSSVRVTRAEFGPIQLAAGAYAGAIFEVDVAA